MGDARLARLAPSTDPQKVAQLLAATTETARVHRRATACSRCVRRRPAADPRCARRRGPRARAARGCCRSPPFSIRSTRRANAIRRAASSFPLLDQASAGAASFKGEIAQTRDKIDPSGDVVDHASPELKLIRDRLRKQRARLRGTLESYLRGKDTAKYLQDQVVTERNGRYVLVVKSEHRSGIPGIVHGASTSGASLFLEPLSTVEINNDIVALEEQEAEEVRRILLALTDAFRSRGRRHPAHD